MVDEVLVSYFQISNCFFYRYTKSGKGKLKHYFCIIFYSNTVILFTFIFITILFHVCVPTLALKILISLLFPLEGALWSWNIQESKIRKRAFMLHLCQ